MTRGVTHLLLAFCASGFLACATATPPEGSTPEAFAETKPEPELDLEQGNSDPLQGFNRSMFWFNNDVLDRFIYGPISHGWIYISPLTVRVHIEQFFDNLNFPGYFVQPLLQGDPKQSGIALARFGINTTVGVAGIFDPANHYLGLARRQADMGQTFGVWGIPPGPYLVLPLVAPRSSVRDFVGWPVDQVLNVGDTYFWSWFAPYGETFVRDINRRALVDADLEAAREAAVDMYSAAREAYLTGRERDVRNGQLPRETPAHDLYEIDESETLPE